MSYGRIKINGQPDLVVPLSITTQHFCVVNGQRTKMNESELLVKSWEVVADDGFSPVDAAVDRLPQFTDADLQLLGFAEQDILDQEKRRSEGIKR